jgi:hypothetical protein
MIKGVIIPKSPPEVISPAPWTTQITPPLEDAAAALEALAAGETPDRTGALLVAAQHLDALCTRGLADRELLDAATGLKAIATGGVLNLDDAGRQRARAVAAYVQQSGAQSG